ncbi:hypothetical protein NPIL_483161 [Nephila pilipes]|uniref:Uncharacterized protein n=1 Tax=Nephila pilipes TaxID=299642 RepID=A0A8X6U311_NEPPI|nr:hypothetical protein NPIL_483161 [Nephila pilipes]
MSQFYEDVSDASNSDDSDFKKSYTLFRDNEKWLSVLEMIPFEEHFANIPTGENVANIPTGENVANIPIGENVANIPMEENFANISMEENVENIPMKENVENIPMKENVENIPMEENFANIPIEENFANIPIEENDANIPIEENDANIPIEENDANIPFEGNLMDPEWVLNRELEKQAINEQSEENIPETGPEIVAEILKILGIKKYDDQILECMLKFTTGKLSKFMTTMNFENPETTIASPSSPLSVSSDGFE